MWKSPDGRTRNQIDHVLIQRKYRSSITDVRSYKGIDCDPDHFTIITKLKTKLKCQEKFKIKKINIEMLKYIELKKQYKKAIDKTVERVYIKDEEMDCKAIRKVITETTKQSIGKSKNGWYNSNYQKTIEKR